MQKMSNFNCDRRIVDESVYPYDMGNGSAPFRRNVDFFWLLWSNDFTFNSKFTFDKE